MATNSATKTPTVVRRKPVTGQAPAPQDYHPIISPDQLYDHYIDPLPDEAVENLEMREISHLSGPLPSENDGAPPEVPNAGAVEEIEEHVTPPRQWLMWNSWWLSFATLLSFLILYLCLLVTVILLYRLSEDFQGIATSKTAVHYAWTYGPMALIVSIATAWHQVDYYSRLLAPWQSLKTGPKPSRETLLVDYLTPIAPIVCVDAIRNKNWAVVASSLGALLLDLALVFSPGLFILSPIDQDQAIGSIQVNSTFSVTGYNITKADTAPGLKIYGNLEAGLGLPFGTTDSIAFEIPSLSDEPAETTVVTANLSVFAPSFECQTAVVDVQIEHDSLGNSTDYSSIILVPNMKIPGCKLATDYFGEVYLLREVMPYRLLTSYEGMSLCQGEDYYTHFPWTFVVIDMRYWQTFGPSLNDSLNVTWYAWEVANATAIACHPSYSIQTASLELDAATGSVLAVGLHEGSVTSASSQLDGFTNYNFSAAVSQGLNPLYQQLTPQWAKLDLAKQQSDTPLFALMSMLDPSNSLETLLDPTLMMNATTAIFNSVAVQMAHELLMVPAAKTAPSNAQRVLHRVTVRLLSTVVLSVVFGLLAVASLSILALRPKNVIPRHPNSILTHAAILSSTEGLLEALRMSGGASNDDLAYLMYGREYSSILSKSAPGSRFDLQSSLSQMGQVELHPTPFSQWWRPFASRLYFVLLNTILGLGAIAGLEVVQRLSSPSSGFVQLQISRNEATAWSSYVPTSVMVIIKIALKSQGFAITLLMPFSLFKYAKPAGRIMVARNLVGQLPILNLWKGLRHCQLGLIGISAAILLSSGLTIIVSGLYTVQSFGISSTETVKTLDRFDLDWNTSFASESPPNDGQAGVIFTLLDWHNLTDPPLVHRGLVFPNLSMSVADQVVNSTGTKIRLKIPATRATLNCTFAVPGSAMSVLTQPLGGPPGQGYILVQGNEIEVPQICSGRSGLELINITTSMPAEIFLKQGSYFSIPNEYPWTSNSTDYPGICPSFGFTFGFTGPHSNSSQNISCFTCYQMIEEVDTLSTFLWPSLYIDPTVPPEVDESSARVIAPHAAYNLNEVFANNLGTLQYAPLEPFFLHVLTGTEGVPPEEVIGLANQDLLITAVQHTYRLYMVQAINRNMRKPVGDESTVTFTAEVINPNSLCLVQNKIPKLILQALLGCTLLCTLIAYVLTPMRRVLTHNPLTIGGTMSLLAGGPLGKRQPEGGMMPNEAIFLSDARMEGLIDWQRWNLRLGWWGENGPIADDQGLRRRFRRGWRAKITIQDNLENTSGSWFGIGLVPKEIPVKRNKSSRSHQRGRQSDIIATRLLDEDHQ